MVFRRDTSLKELQILSLLCLRLLPQNQRHHTQFSWTRTRSSRSRLSRRRLQLPALLQLPHGVRPLGLASRLSPPRSTSSPTLSLSERSICPTLERMEGPPHSVKSSNRSWPSTRSRLKPVQTKKPNKPPSTSRQSPRRNLTRLNVVFWRLLVRL